MHIWDFIHSQLKLNNNIMLLVVVDSTGSSPGRKGFKLAVSNDGSMEGSIGGGMLEYDLVELAKTQFGKNSAVFSLVREHAKESENTSGMICSGSQQVAFYPIYKSDLSVVEKIISAQKGSVIFSQKGIFYDPEIENQDRVISEKEWVFHDGIGFNQRLFIFGAGHVSLAVSKIAKDIGFQVNLFDDRSPELKTYKENLYADNKRIIDYHNVSKYVPDVSNIYILIMTYAHKSDSNVLEKLLTRNVRYLGMMGSTNKVKSIFSELRSKGVSSEMLSKVDAPVGLPINSQTPEEIAVSIVAKLIQVKNEDK